ncbi:hypothetical protein VTK56DRAFT_1952 [Thermocarpiscus australiensis]
MKRTDPECDMQQVCAWACVGLSIEAVRWGNGKHFDLLDLDAKQGAIKYTIFAFPPGILSFSLPKFAVVSLLTRLLNPSRWHRIFLWALAGVCNLILIGCVIILFAQCDPSASQWDFSLTPQAKCWDKWILVSLFDFCRRYVSSPNQASPGCPADLPLTTNSIFGRYRPLPGRLSDRRPLQPADRGQGEDCALLRPEHRFRVSSLVHDNTPQRSPLSTRQKTLTSPPHNNSSTAVATYKTTRIPSLASDDFSYDTADLVIWTIVEGSTLIIAACIPILQPLIDLVIGRTTLQSSRSKSSGYGPYGSSGHGTSGKGGGLRSGDVEMQHGGWRRFGRPRDPDEDLLRTNMTIRHVDPKDNDGKGSSQESILAPVAEEDGQLQQQHSHAAHTQPHPNDDDHSSIGRTAAASLKTAAEVGLASSSSTTEPRAPPLAAAAQHNNTHDGIVRTREVRVEYGDGPSPDRWGALHA